MSLITESQLRGYSSNKTVFSANEGLKGYRNESTHLKTKVFLSHKHDEIQNLESAIAFLKKEGVNVYVDWLDEGMPKTTSGITASGIKSKIKENKKFIFLASEGAINSKWCNWELGFGDAHRYINDIALLPIEKDYTNFSGAEYLQIYPFIEFQNGTNKYSNNQYIPKGFYVRYPTVNNQYNIVPLREWLL
jgi:hypothetical protein